MIDTHTLITLQYIDSLLQYLRVARKAVFFWLLFLVIPLKRRETRGEPPTSLISWGSQPL